MSIVGTSVPRLEGMAKVRGRAAYVDTLTLPGMLHAKLYRSPVAHARILSIDTARAAAVPGVVAVLTVSDVARVMPSLCHGPAFWDQPVLADDRVRHVGEPVAVVVAEAADIAAAAANLITARFEELPAVFDEVEAASPGAPVIHSTLTPAGTFPDLRHLTGTDGGNVAMDARLRKGDVEAGFAQADRVFESSYRCQHTSHVPLELLVSVAEPNGQAITIDSSTQNASFIRMELARLLGWPENRVRVRAGLLGGGFGAKLYIKTEAISAACALLCGRPVRVAVTMAEQFQTITRLSCTIRMRTGVTRDGRIVARSVGLWWNGGAYADIGPRVTEKSGLTAMGPYDVTHVAVDSYAVYTNLPPAGALRGFGIPQIAWALESDADTIAHALAIDPVEFRRRNLLRNGCEHATGTILRDAYAPEILERIAARLDWTASFDRGSGALRRGRGVGLALKACLAPTVSLATLTMQGDGSCTIACTTSDMGQGSETVMAQIAAEVLGLQPEAVSVIRPDTDVTPYDMGTLGARSTFHMGNAVKAAAEEVRDQLAAIAAPLLQCRPGEIGLSAGEVVGPGGQSLRVSEVMRAHFGMQAGNLIGRGAYQPRYHEVDPETGQTEALTPFWMAGGAGAEITVDTETGRIVIDRLIVAGDTGALINPAAAERQLIGAALMQVGVTLFEDLQFEAGRIRNPGLAEYKVPTIMDLPGSIAAEIVAVPHPDGPFGAKGLGETGTFAVSPAIANALFDATGVRITELPLTPERVLRALASARQVAG